jgi:DNA-binding CsgD family transcriptional regulator
VTGPINAPLFAAVDSLLAAGRVAEAVEVAEAALVEGALSGKSAAQLRLKLSSALLMSGYAAKALSQAEEVLAGSRLDAEVYEAGRRACLIALMAHDEFAAAREPAVAILAGTTSSSDDGSIAAALTTLGSVAWTEGRVADSIMLLRGAVTRAQRGRFADRALHPRQSLAVLLIALGELGKAEELLREDVRDIRAEDDRGWMVGVAAWRSRLHLAAGRIAEAVAHAESALALADETGTRLFVPLARTTLAAAALHRGDLDPAEAVLERCQDEPPASRAQFLSTYGAWIRARISDARDGPIVAMRSMAAVFDNLPANKRALLEEPALAAWLVRCALAAGDRTKARAVVDTADQLSLSNTAFPSVAAIALHARGVFEQDAAALLQASSDHAHVWARASAAEDAGAVLVAEDQPQSGSATLESAIALYEQAGAVHDAERATRRWRELRVRTVQAAGRHRVSGWSGLTGPERRVSGLVALGLTNAQVGERLSLSRHDVDFQLRQIFRKLGVHTRVELARLAMEHEASWHDD